ncbi:MAG: class I SAM-dependent methyltransferase [Dermatophilaceae bacterium]
MNREPSLWERRVAENPGHSEWYVNRFRRLAADGVDIVGEGRTLDAMLERGSRVLDAGCGPGRIGGYLHAAGHAVVGVDVDPVLIEAAEADYPGPTWLVADLATLDLPSRGIPQGFDAIVCAGNVMTFLAPSTRRDTLDRLCQHLDRKGRAVIGFGAGRGYPFEEFLEDVAMVGMVPDLLLATWDLRPLSDDSDFLVAVLRHA